jgi:hypothetical protein
MKDFSRQPKVVEFKINDDIFRGKPFLAAQTMIDFTLKVDKLGEDITAQQGFDTMAESLQLVLMPDSYKRFRDRMEDPASPDMLQLTGQPPIELPQVNEIIEWIMEEYGMRPPASPEDSSNGPSNPAPGTNSTESASAEGSTSSISQPTNS